MNNLNDHMLDEIYKHKHQMQMNDTMNELTQLQINCRYLCSFTFVKTSRYPLHDDILKACTDSKI